MASDTSSPADAGPATSLPPTRTRLIGGLGLKMRLVGLILLILRVPQSDQRDPVPDRSTIQIEQREGPARGPAINLPRSAMHDRWIITGYLTIVGVVVVFVGAVDPVGRQRRSSQIVDDQGQGHQPRDGGASAPCTRCTPCSPRCWWQPSSRVWSSSSYKAVQVGGGWHLSGKK